MAEEKKNTKVEEVKEEKKEVKEEKKATGDITQILDDMTDGKIKSKKQEKKEQKKPQPAAKKEDPTQPKKDEKFTKDWTINYAGLEDEMPKKTPKEGIALEDLRKHLQKMYPEMSKERTVFQLDRKEKRIVPIISGGKKG